MTLLITGAAGTIGTHLATSLADHGVPLRLLDRRPLPHPPAGAEIVSADLRDLPAVEQATAGSSAIIHLAGVTQEGPFAEMVGHNITATHHVLEAARRQHVPRVVLASSHHVIGLTRIGDPAPALATDSFYAVSKITAEALGHLYAQRNRPDRRRCAHRQLPTTTQRTPPPRHLAQPPRRHHPALQRRHPAHPQPFLTLYGTSDTPETWWPRTGWGSLDYQPADSIDHHTTPAPLPDRFVGGVFADHDLPAS
ncbi:NAD-dependent epimerase/dehydratase family protein [Nocardia wallacei]|uniref:NAD-dependent epimerase/dehydratase family protein n=1 Tax=Nocardia wallacei TaxID=480035 RepID=UPI002457B8C9|nr:NAD(P)-dependent oxidoreductase [Nocardia wallacei]